MKREVTKITEGLPGAEGPVFDRDGRFFMVWPGQGQVLEILEGGEKVEICNTGGIPAGLQVDPDNVIWIADMKRGILKTTREGELTAVVETYEGLPIRGCNDVYFDGQGNLYFSAPVGSNADDALGEVYVRLTDGSVHRLDDGYKFSNGLAVTDDDKTLIVAETYTKSLWAYDVSEPGTAKNKRLFAKVPGDDEGGPDGMDFDEAGNLLVAHWAGSSVDVFTPDGELLERVEMPFERTTNVHFGGEDNAWVYVTAGTPGELWKFKWDRPGQKQFCER
jgi:gluconolactonase